MANRKRKGERPDGLIQVSLQIGFKPNGKPDRKYFYGRSRAEANRKRSEYKQRMLAGSSDPDITVGEWIEKFKSIYRSGINAAYLGKDDVPYKRLSAAIGHMRMVDVRESDLQYALNAVSGMSYSTVDKYAQCIRRVFLRAQKNKIISDNPASDLMTPPSVKGSHRALERWETELILDNWNQPSAYPGLWVLLMLLSGLRRSEMMALDWDAVDLSARTLSVCRVAVVKTNQPVYEHRAKSDAGLRTLPLCQALFLALSSVPKEKRSGFVCRNKNGEPLTPTSVKTGLNQFCAMLSRIFNGEPAEKPVRLSRAEQQARKELHESPDYTNVSFTAHDLRHTFATALYDAGVPVKAAQYFLGHSDIRITLDLYTHLSKERDAASRQQMIALFDSWIDDRMKSISSLPEPSMWTASVITAKAPEK